MAKFGWHGAGVSLAAVCMAFMLSSSAAQASGQESLWNQQRDSAGQDDAIPVSINGQVVAKGGKAITTTRIVNDGSEAPFMYEGSTAALQAAEAKYQSIAAQGGWGTVSSSRFKKGDQNKAIAVLNRRLVMEGYLRPDAAQGEFAQVYTSATEQAVKDFQHNHGLPITGALDNGTIKELNIPVAARLATIRANLPRLAHNAQALGPRYLIVNVPAQQLETIENGKVYSIHNVIVGRPSRPTPVVLTHIQTIRFNPYWNAPASIVQRDLIPRMLSGGPKAVMDQMNMKIFKGYNGPEVNPNSVNWRTANPSDYYFRQEPGGSNAMATAKIEFNSPFGIYLHDTPEPELFNSGQRFYSSGCVRVQNVAVLLNWILNGQDGFNPAKIAEMAKTKERLDVTVQNAPQIRVAYLTAWPVGNGTVAFRPDVYQMDGSGFVVGQPNPVGDSGPRYVLKPVPWQSEAIASEGGGDFFANLFSRSYGRNASNTDAAGRELSSTASASSRAAKAKLASATSASTAAAKPRKPFNFFESTSTKSKTASSAPATKKKLTVATAKPAPKTAASADAKSCKPGKDGKPVTNCKLAPAAATAVKPKQKLADTTASAN